MEINYRLLFRFENSIRITLHSLGLVGNLLLLIVYFVGSLRKMSISVYFRCVAVLSLCQNIYELARYLFPIDGLEARLEILCKLSDFYFIFSKPTSAWLEILAGLDRFLTIVYPHKFKFLKRPLVQWILVASVIIYNVGCYAKILVDTQLEIIYDEYSSYGNSTECFLNISHELNLLDLVNGAAIPFASMGVLSILTLLGVRRAHSQIDSSIANPTHRRRTIVHDIKFGLTMIVLNILFFIFNLPYRLYYILDLGELNLINDTDIVLLLNIVFKLFFEGYYSIVFWVQLAVNSVVRKETRGLFMSIWLTSKRIFEKFLN